MLEYLFIAFLVIFGIQFLYYTGVFSRFSFQKSTPSKSNFTAPVSVLICAKNESENLKNNLPYFLQQSYKNFELVLINDCSNDDTLLVMEAFKAKSSIPVKIVDVVPNEQFWGSKKYALTLGIKVAANEHLILTDADCMPIGPRWIATMASQFSTTNSLVLGYGAYQKIKKSFLNKLIRFETVLTAMQYMSFAISGMPYMGVGRNLAYTKSLFFGINGFISHMQIKSGDDDLFVNQVANKKNTKTCIEQDSFTLSMPKTTWKDWIYQKRRHISTASHYKRPHQLLLGTFYFSQIMFWLLAAVLLLFQFNWEIVTAIFVFRSLLVGLIIGRSMVKLDEKDLIPFGLLLEVFLILLQMFIFIKNLISKPTHW